ncbi:MAG: Tn3 family transposase [Symploca sp. SIO1C4]|uniref:Tn3 family transposase n=1 Tax=Symploca sp. SIO1C4 TaxID=2607765 RepID=A0A6B3NKS7_9CYAN|nr:Tn3 family transposase [Symploca sp. SIO1C4]NET08247.1 Tn3 family transposase [Symploca sp. SIO2B6]NET47316.1 Tn3 family transposase [Merismopedia sp. SIO2A8]
MTVVSRTAYPQFKRYPSPKELHELYTPTSEEFNFVNSRTKSHTGLLGLMVMLKSFQRLGYFTHPELVPHPIIIHLRSCLELDSKISPIPSLRSIRYYQEAIRTYLDISPYNEKGQKLAASAISQAAEVKDHPADLINVAIEELVKERYELPAFSTLDRLVGHIRSVVNTRLFKRVARQLSPQDRHNLDNLLVPDSQEAIGEEAPVPEAIANLNLLKSPPKSHKLSHLKELQSRFNAMMAIGDAKKLLLFIPATKVKSFAAQARTLDISEFRDLKLAKRRTLLLCLLYQAQVKTRDHLVEMFLKRMGKIHNSAKTRLVELREKYLNQTQSLLSLLREILVVSSESTDNAQLGQQVKSLLAEHGGAEQLLEKYSEIAAVNTKNHFPLLWSFYSRYRKVLFDLVSSLEIRSTSSEQSVMEALKFVLNNQEKRGKFLEADIDLSFISDLWRKLVIKEVDGKQVLVRRQLEICIFSYLAAELKTGDVCVVDSENYADFRQQLLSWSECLLQIPQYCSELGIPHTAEKFVEHLKTQLTNVARDVDIICKQGDQITISEEGIPVLKRITAQKKPDGTEALETAIWERLPRRSLLDILCNVEHWLNWTQHFGPISGSEPKLSQPQERYILTTFGYGCNLGPNEMARHVRGKLTSHMLSYTNRRHVTSAYLEAAIRDIINAYNRLTLPKCWGSGKRAAADGSKFEIYENNLLSEYHIRYGGYGGIAYHHVSDTYIALFTHFITCGVWEAVYILDGLLKNTSDIQPDILHADTQGQSSPVFALSYLLGIELMPRIRNWKDLDFLRPYEEVVYDYIEPLFKGVAQWHLIETHWQDFLRVILSIKAGKLLPSTILRKLGSYSRKNRLYQAFRALGMVIRTLYLLRFISDRSLRREVTACTNIVEDYHRFLNWLFFGKDGVITENDPVEQEKRLKYLDLVASAVILQNTVDLTRAIQTLSAEGFKINRTMLATLSPYITRNLKRYGDYVVDLNNIPQPWEGAINLPIGIFET